MRQALTTLKSLVTTALFELELIVFVVTATLTLIAHLKLSQYQTIRPFYPQDTSLWLPFNGDSIKTSTLFILYYLILTPIMFFLKLQFFQNERNFTKRQQRVMAARFAFGLWNGLMVAMLLVEIFKSYVGRLRPSFGQACLGQEPPYSPELLSRIFRSNEECLTENKEVLQDMRRSFPSGHSAVGLGGAVYIQLCLFAMAQEVEGDLIALIMFTSGWLITAFGFWVASSRVVDGAHHVGDVATGALIGIWAACSQFWYVNGRMSWITAKLDGKQSTTEDKASSQTKESKETESRRVEDDEE